MRREKGTPTTSPSQSPDFSGEAPEGIAFRPSDPPLQLQHEKNMKIDHLNAHSPLGPETPAGAPTSRTAPLGGLLLGGLLLGGLLVGTLLGASCSGGGDMSPTPPPPAGGERLHAFLNGALGGGTLALLNPSAPTQPIPIPSVPSVDFDFNLLLSGTLDVAAGALRNPSVDRLVFGVGMDLLEVSLAQPSAGASPADRIVTTLGANIDEVHVSMDYSTSPHTTIYVVDLVGGTSVTFDQVGQTVSPVLPFPGEHVAPTLNRATGSINGWLALESNTLTHVARDLTVTNLAAASEASYIDATNGGDAFLFLGDRFASYRQDGSLVDVAFVPSGNGTFDPEDIVAADADALYFFSAPSGTTFEVVRALGDGTAAPITLEFMGTPNFLTISQSRVLFGYLDALNGGESLVSVDLMGGDQVMLETGADGLDASLSRFPGTNAVRLIYELESAGSTDVIDIADDGTDRQVYADARLAGLSVAGDLFFHAATNVDAVYITTAAPAGNLRIEVIEPGAPATRATMGLLPLGFEQANIISFYTSTAIVTGTRTTGTPASDVFFLRKNQPNSLVRVTDTSSTFELGVL